MSKFQPVRRIGGHNSRSKRSINYREAIVVNDKIFHATVDGWYEARVIYAVTMFDQADAGVLLWAGRLQASALTKTGEQIEAQDYMQKQTVISSSWEEAWTYLENQPKFASLVPRLRRLVGEELERSQDISAR